MAGRTGASGRRAIPESGNYEISVFIADSYATTESAHYHIYRYGSEIGTATVNQLAFYDQWVSLGAYYLPAGSYSKVYLDDMTDNQDYATEKIGFDAVRFVCQDCGPEPTATPGPTPTPHPTATPTPIPQPFRIDSVQVMDSSGNKLPWDALVDDTLIVKARGSGDNPPTFVQARVTSLQSG